MAAGVREALRAVGCTGQRTRLAAGETARGKCDLSRGVSAFLLSLRYSETCPFPFAYSLWYLCAVYESVQVNMNEELAAPILTSVSSAWEAVFVKDLDNHLKQLMCEIKSEVKKFHEQLTPKLLQAGLDEGRLESIRAPLDAALATRTEKAADKVKEAVQAKQKELSRSIAPQVQQKMQPGYQTGYLEAGTGSHRRRVAIIEKHIQKESKTMFAEAVAPVMAAMIPLRKELQKLVASVCVDLTVQELRENFGMLWEPTTAKSKAGKRAELLFTAVLVVSLCR